MATRKAYPSDVSDEEWAFVAPYLALIREDAPQREYDLREVENGVIPDPLLQPGDRIEVSGAPARKR